MSVDTLDNVFQKSTLEGRVEVINPDFVKLDTQGTELYILKGMQHTLTRSIFGVEAEVQFIEMYRGQPLSKKIDSLYE